MGQRVHGGTLGHANLIAGLYRISGGKRRFNVSKKEFLLLWNAIVFYQFLNAVIAVFKVFVKQDGRLHLGIIRGWDSNWYGGNDYGDSLLEDSKIRKYLNARLAKASVSRIVIERTLKLVTITVCTARPGIIIGKGGQEVDKLKEELKKVTDKDIQINIFEVKRPELDAVIVANNIARQVEGKIAYRRAIKMAIANTMRMGAEGIKIQISGRLNGAEMARSEMYKEGRTPLHTFRADIDYCHAEALTKVGLLGIKVWICRGEVFGKRELAPNFTQSKESGRGNNGGNNGGKNFKRKKNNR